jgi:hypothetical protein
MVFAFRPKARQVLPLQEINFPAAVATVPGRTLTPVISEENEKAHCTPAGRVPPVEVIVTGTLTVPPADPVTDPNENATV